MNRAHAFRRAGRRGTVLVWFAVMLFVLMPLMALVVHVGMATLTRRQMQAAANAAAVEGLRLRDDESIAPADRDASRRARAAALVSTLFDDNLDAGDGDAMNFGAGPAIRFDDEPTDVPLEGTDFRASRTIRLANLAAYQPELELNLSNEPYGDMVSGDFDEGDLLHREDGQYLRTDFIAAFVGDAFLTRLRRTLPSTSEIPALDDVPGVSSAGPTVPFLFGRGPYGGSDFLDRRERGTIVRVTAIASAVPAMTVGVSTQDTAGIAPLWLEYASWNAMVNDVPAAVTASDSEITGEVTGGFMQPRIVTVGERLTPDAGSAISGTHYIPVVAQLPSGDWRVVGFGIADLSLTPAGGTITRRASRISPRNASAAWSTSLAGFSPDDLTALMALRGTLAEPLLAPALRRSIP